MTPTIIDDAPGAGTAPAPSGGSLREAAAAVEQAAFPLDLPGAAAARALRAELLGRLRSRLGAPAGHRPAVVVLGGPSGAGKSALVNAIVGEAVTASGVLRPTTRRAVLVAHPDDDVVALAEWATIVEHSGVPAGIALLDAPDLDAVDPANRSRSRLLLQVADVWLFTTSAGRYGDAVPWEQLRAAAGRGLTTAVVLNRVPPRILREVRADLLARLDALGLGGAPLFVVPDAGPLEGPLPPGVAAELTDWLALVGQRRLGAALAARSDRGAATALPGQLLRLADAADAQFAAAAALRRAITTATEAAVTDLTDAVTGAGAGAPAGYWRALTGRGGVLAPVVSGRGGRGARALSTRSVAADRLGAEVAAVLTVLLAEARRSTQVAVERIWADPDLGAPALPAAAASELTTLPPVPAGEAGSGAAGAATAQPGESPVDLPGADESRRVAAGLVAAWRAAVVDAVSARPPLLDRAGVAGVVEAGAVGVPGAAEVAERLTPGAVDRAGADLVDRSRAAVRAAADPHLTALAALVPTAGSPLRRAARLEGRR